MSQHGFLLETMLIKEINAQNLTVSIFECVTYFINLFSFPVWFPISNVSGGTNLSFRRTEGAA